MKDTSTTVLSTKWQDIKVRRAEPAVYLRYFKRLEATRSHISTSYHFFLEKQYAHCELFYEQLDVEIWLLVIENSSKSDNRYLIKPKLSTDYYSLNIFSTPTKMGYREHNKIKWGTEHVWFMTPDAEFELFQESDAVIRCVRIIFTKKYLATLTNDHNSTLLKKLTEGSLLHRGASKAELLLQFRVINVLKYERGKYHYKASLLSNIFEHLAFFLKLSLNKIQGENVRDKNYPYEMIKAASLIEQQLSKKFPGISALAAQCSMSPTKFKQEFKRIHGLTPLEYFRTLQIIDISDLSKNRKKTVKELAIEMGLNKHSDFSKWYKKVTEQF